MKDNSQRRNITIQPQNQNRNNQMQISGNMKPRSYNYPNNINNMNLNKNQGNLQDNKIQSGNFKIYESNNYNYNFNDNFNNNFNNNNFNDNNNFNSNNNNNYFNNNIVNNNIQNNFNSNNNDLYNNNQQENMNYTQNNCEDDRTLKILEKENIIKQNINNFELIFNQNGNFDEEILNEIKDICLDQFTLKNLSETKIDDKIAQRIKQKYGGEWFVLICELSPNKEQEDFDFKFTNIPRKNIIIFTRGKFRFYVCKLRD